jgi:DNA-binding XRE family transcriptional regulator
MNKTEGIKNFRDRMRWNQAQLAKKVDLLQSTVSSWEKGKNVPSFHVARKLMEMGATVEEVFGLKYNEMHSLVKAESATSNELQEVIRRLITVESELNGIKKQKAEPAAVAQAG